MRVLITGAAGQVGRALSSSAPGTMQMLACSRQELDITDAETVAQYVRRTAPELIINAAAYTAADRAESEPDLAQAINAHGPRNLATAAGQVNARLIHISTDYVFDGNSSVPYKPGSPTNPLSVYGVTKCAGDAAVLDVLPGSSVVVRTAWVYAAQGRNFVQTILRLLRTNGSVRVVADRVGTPTSAHSLAHALWHIAAKPEITGIHHWTDAGVASWYDFAVAIAEDGAAAGLLPAGATVVPISADEYPTPARRPAYSVLDKGSLTSLGFEPTHWRKQLRAIFQEMKHA